MIKNIFKGFIIGIAKIIPGVSGSMLAISLNVYEKLMMIIADIRNVTVSSFKFLFSISFGILIGISLFSGGVKWLLNHFYFPIMLLFVGLIIGGIPELVREVYGQKIRIKNVIIFILALTLSYILSNLGVIGFKNIDNIFMYFLLGLIEAFSSLIPGISGTAIYMSLGVYDMLLSFFSNIFNPLYFKFAIFFTGGLLIGIMLVAKTITYLLQKYKIDTYYAIFGFMIFAIIAMLKDAFVNIYDNMKIFNIFMLFELLLGLLFLFVGYKITVKISVLLSKS